MEIIKITPNPIRVKDLKLGECFKRINSDDIFIRIYAPKEENGCQYYMNINLKNGHYESFKAEEIIEKVECTLTYSIRP